MFAQIEDSGRIITFKVMHISIQKNIISLVGVRNYEELKISYSDIQKALSVYLNLIDAFVNNVSYNNHNLLTKEVFLQ